MSKNVHLNAISNSKILKPIEMSNIQINLYHHMHVLIHFSVTKEIQEMLLFIYCK